MSAPLLMRPIPAANVFSYTPGDNADALRTPDPREVYRSIPLGTGSGPTIVSDMGAPTAADTFYLGWTTCPAADPAFGFVVGGSNSADQNTATYFAQTPIFNPAAGVQHCLAAIAAPVTYRYYFMIPTIGAQGDHPVNVGIVAVGRSLRPSIGGIEYGAGRFVGDTGTVERLPSGSFALDEGATYGGYQGTMADLTAAETEQLYALLRRGGSARSVLFHENPDPDPAFNERTHWGILSRLEPYERTDPLFTKWGFRIEDWS